MFGITDRCIVSLFNRHTEIFEVVGNASFSTPPLIVLLNSSLWTYFCFYGHSSSRRVLVGDVGNPESSEGFQSGLLKSCSLPRRRHPRQLPQDSLAFSVGGRKVIETNGLS